MSRASDRRGRVLASKLANALITDATTARMFSGGASGLILEGFRRKFGGLWVGGKVTLTEEELIFAPNLVNRLTHVGVSARTIPLANVVRATDRFGLFTRIIDVALTDGSLFTFRCFGAEAFAEKITGAATAARPD